MWDTHSQQGTRDWWELKEKGQAPSPPWNHGSIDLRGIALLVLRVLRGVHWIKSQSTTWINWLPFNASLLRFLLLLPRINPQVSLPQTLVSEPALRDSTHILSPLHLSPRDNLVSFLEKWEDQLHWCGIQHLTLKAPKHSVSGGSVGKLSSAFPWEFSVLSKVLLGLWLHF